MSSSHPNGAAIGIDFGTSFCRAASLERGALRIHPNEDGNRSTPVYLTFKEDGTVMSGEFVKRYYEQSITPTVFGIKRLLFEEPVQRSDNYPFSYDREVRSTETLFKSSGRVTEQPQTMVSRFLRQLKDDARWDGFTGITTAFITVPACFRSPFTDFDEAARQAGFTELQVIQESKAAAMAYAFDNNIVTPQSLMVFSLGGGFLEAAFFNEVSTTKISLSPGCLVAKAFDCGGEEFTQCMVHLLAQRCHKELGCDLLAKPKVNHNVRLQAEKLKHTLQVTRSAIFSFDCVSGDRDFTGKVMAAEYIEATKPLVDNIWERLQFFKKTLSDPNEVKEIVLVGGSSRLKCVRNLLTETFPGASFKESINPDEAAVYGAAVLAHFFQKGQLKFNKYGFEIRTHAQDGRTKREVRTNFDDARGQKEDGFIGGQNNMC